jgi:glycosyltransferase involved in cell wall biosynthesis
MEELLCDGQNGILVDATADSLVDALTRFLGLTADERKSMGEAAMHAVARYSEKRFVAGWRTIYGQTAIAR